MRTRRLIGAALMGVLLVLSLTVAAQTPGPYAAQVQQAIRSLLAGTAGSFTTVTVTPSGSVRLQMGVPTGVAVTPSQLGTDLAAGVYTMTVTSLDPATGQTSPPTAVTCTVTAGGTGRCAVSWDAVQGSFGYRVWTSLADVATPTRYFAVASTLTSYNLDTLTGATVATLPTANTAYRVSLGTSVGNWFHSPVLFPASTYLNFGSTSGTTGYGVRDNAGAIELKNSGGAWTGLGGLAPSDATYITQTASSGLSAEQALGVLSTGVMQVTTTSGAVSSFVPSANTIPKGSSSLFIDSAITEDGTSVSFARNLVASGVGPHSLGGAVSAGTQFYHTGMFSPAVANPRGLFLDNTLTPNGDGGTVVGLGINTVANRVNGWTGGAFHAVSLAPSVTRASGTTTLPEATSLYIAGAPSAGTGVTITDPYALWVDDGVVRLDANLLVGTTIQAGTTVANDPIIISPAALGANAFALTLSTLDLTAARAINFPNNAGTVALTADNLSAFAATTSAELFGVISDETGGTGVLVGSIAPTFTTSATMGSGGVFQIAMATPTITSATKDDASGSLLAGVYKVTVVARDHAGGVTLSPTALSATCAGGTSQIVVVYVAPQGIQDIRVYVSAADGATPDRYFTSTSLTTYTITTLVGATVAALPAAATAYVVSMSAAQSWGGGAGLFTTKYGYFAAYQNTGANVTANGYAAAQSNTGANVTANGLQAAYLNTGASVTATGYQAAQSNTGASVTATGYAAAQSNTGASVTATGYAAAYQNTGASVTATGLNAANQNTGASVTATGYYAAYQNTGASVTATGYYAANQNTGASVTATGYQAARANNWPNYLRWGVNTAVANYFPANAATDYAFTETEITANTITGTHSFPGANGSKINLLYTKTAGTTPEPAGLVTGTVYQFTRTSATVLTLAGIATTTDAAFAGKLTNSIDQTGSIVIGDDAMASKANQVTLGPTTIVETVLRGNIINPVTLVMSTTAPTIASGGCTSPAVTWSNGTAAFQLTIGTSCTGVQTITLTFPAATNGWVCDAHDVTTPASFVIAQASTTPTAVVFNNYARVTGLAADFTASEVLLVKCSGG